MLQIPNLDDITYEQLLQNAIHKIPQLTGEWTDFNLHDPGITTLEIYAWLTDMLNYYINASGDIHVKKYMKLLGIEAQKSSPAGCWLSFKGPDTYLPKGLPIYADNRCFTTLEETSVAENQLLGVYTGQNGRIEELTAFAGKEGGYITAFDKNANKNQELFLAFEKPLSGQTTLFVQVKEEYARTDRQINLSVLRVSYYDGNAWQEAQILSDQSVSLLKSGCITINIDGFMCRDENADIPGYLLKMEAAQNFYTCAPKIGGIFLNPAKVSQKEEICRRICIPLTDGQMIYQIPEYVSEQESAAAGLFFENGSECRMLLDFGEENNEQICIDLKEGQIKLAEEICSLKVYLDLFLVKNEVLSLLQIGTTDGCCFQEYPVFAENICDIELITVNRTDNGLSYRIWQYQDELDGAGSRDCVFTWNEQTQSVRFGDGICGLVPKEGHPVLISRLSVSAFEQGNVLAGEINTIKDAAYQNLQVTNITSARGGCRKESVEEMQKRLEDMIQTQNRVVSSTDYEEKIKQIPGLKIRGTKVIPAALYSRDHGLTYRPYEIWAVVCPDTQERTFVLDSAYEEAVIKWLEPYRMLNTKIRVTAPSYAAIHASGRLQINGSRQPAAAKIIELIKDYISGMEKECCFGAVISYADLFMKLESLECVNRVEELHISVGGTMGHKNDRGDIILNGDCLPYVGDIIFEYK